MITPLLRLISSKFRGIEKQNEILREQHSKDVDEVFKLLQTKDLLLQDLVDLEQLNRKQRAALKHARMLLTEVDEKAWRQRPLSGKKKLQIKRFKEAVSKIGELRGEF